MRSDIELLKQKVQKLKKNGEWRQIAAEFDRKATGGYVPNISDSLVFGKIRGFFGAEFGT